MPKRAAKPKLFDVMPASQFCRQMLDSLPKDAVLEWRHVGDLMVGKGGLAVIDPQCYTPSQVASMGVVLPWPHPKAEIWLEVITCPDRGVVAVAGAILSAPAAGLPKKKSTAAKEEAGSCPVDSARLLIADLDRLAAGWQLGGPHNETVLGYTTKDPKEKKRKERAAELLTKHGFSLAAETTGKELCYRFTGPLSEEDLARAKALLDEAKIDERLNVIQPHSEKVVEDQIEESGVACLESGGSTCLYAFKPGWGDGTYWWDALKLEGQLLGYLCDFMPPEEEDEDEEEDDEDDEDE